jgi:hypothetical protein
MVDILKQEMAYNGISVVFFVEFVLRILLRNNVKKEKKTKLATKH